MDEQTFHILLVEDEESHAELMRRAFDSCAGQFHLTVAGSLEEARACLAESKPNLVIADLLLPDGRGTELLPAEGEVRRFPLVVMTSHGDEQVAVEAMKAGALDYVVKSEAALAAMPRVAERVLREWDHITEHQRAEEEIRQRSAQLEALRQVGLELAAQLDVDALLHSIVSRAIELLEGASGGLYLYRPERDVLEWSVAVGSRAAPVGLILHRGEGLSGKVWETGEPLVVDDYQHWEGRAAVWEDYHVAAVVGVPIRWGATGAGDEFLGVLDVEAVVPNTFSPADAELLGLFATQAAIAIHNARLYDQAQQEIAGRKRAEAALKEYSERLEEMVKQRTQELCDAQEELIRQERLAVLGQLAGGVAHELRNPLGAIRNAAYFLNLALEEPSSEVKETLEILDREVVKSDTIIKSLLDIARARPPTRREVDVNDVVRAALFNAAVPEDVEVVSELDASLPTILADHIQLDQAFGNIILNAIQAMPEGGQLAVKSAVFDAERVAISFTDTGVGIPEESLERLFESLFTTKSKGIGLGLPLVKMLVEGHGGTVEVESEQGKGSTFTLILLTEEVGA